MRHWNSARRCGGCPILEDSQDQAGPYSEQLELAMDVRVHGKGVD